MALSGFAGGYSGMSLTVLDGDDNKRKIVDHLAGDHKQAVQHSSSLRSGTLSHYMLCVFATCL